MEEKSSKSDDVDQEELIQDIGELNNELVNELDENGELDSNNESKESKKEKRTKKFNREYIRTRREEKARDRREDEDYSKFTRNKRVQFKGRREGTALKERLFGEKGKARRKKARMEFELYTIVFLTHFFFSNIIPMAVFWVYYYFVVHPAFQDLLTPIITSTDRSFTPILKFGEIFSRLFEMMSSDVVVLITFLTIPLVFLAIYLLRLYLIALVGKMIYGFFNWIRPRAELYKANFMGEQADDVNIYHTRNFLLRILKWAFQKSPFPWFTPWMYNYVGSNKLGKNCVVEEGLFTLEFLECGDNVYMAPMAGTTTHFVEGSYQSLTIKGVKIGDNCVVGARNCISPGVEMEEDSQMFQFSGVTKLIKVPAGTDNFGMPASRLPYSKYVEFIDLPDDVKKIDKEINKERRKRLKRMKRKQRE